MIFGLDGMPSDTWSSVSGGGKLDKPCVTWTIQFAVKSHGLHVALFLHCVIGIPYVYLW